VHNKHSFKINKYIFAFFPVISSNKMAHQAFTRPLLGGVSSFLFLFQAPLTIASECGLYLAPSSIPGAGLGMYAGNKSYAKDDQVTYGDIVIPIIELDWNNDMDYGSFVWNEYTWNADVFPGMNEEADDMYLVVVASPGVGAAANSFLPLVNVEDDYMEMSRGVRDHSPGQGAITPYHGRIFRAKVDISAGTEIFVR
jgi:hypothetical protein